MANNLVLGFTDYSGPAKKLAEKLSLPYAEVDIHKFPDGENKITLPTDLPANIIICRTLNNPNEKLVELFLVSQAARAKGCQNICLVLPYLCYMRQDIAFNPGEIVSQHWIGKFISRIADDVITVDPHLHRTHHLSDIITTANNETLSATKLIGDYILNELDSPLILGPDEESKQWVEQIAGHCDLQFAVAEKTRLGDREVDVRLPDHVDLRNKDVVLSDDMISTGNTLIKTIKVLKHHDINSIYCAVTHGLFVEESYQKLIEAGANAIWTTDSIPHKSNVIALADLLAATINSKYH